MSDSERIAFLRWALPRLGYRWAGFRKVRRQVGRRIERRRRELGLESLAAYRALLERDEAEWRTLDHCCRVTISRFYRDRGTWECLGSRVLPELARDKEGKRLTAVSLGCCGGEEPYTLALVWALRVACESPLPGLDVVAIDTDPVVLRRARRAVYARSSLRELPRGWIERTFDTTGRDYRLKEVYRESVRFVLHDLRDGVPGKRFDLVLCRNLAFTYFDRAGQVRAAREIVEALAPGGALVLGSHERLPESDPVLEPWEGCAHVYRRPSGA